MGMPDPKKFSMPWRWTQRHISRETSFAKYDFRISGGPFPSLTPLSPRGLFSKTIVAGIYIQV